MKDEDIRNLLGGYATGTLTESERELLYAAALKDQQLFDALADEESLRELLGDPLSRRQILEALDPVPEKSSVWEALTGWMHRPASWAAAATVIAGLVLAVALRREFPPVTQVAMKTETHAPAPAAVMESRPVREPPRPAAASSMEKSPGPAVAKDVLELSRTPAPPPQPTPKTAASRMKIAVLDFNAPAAPPAVAEVGKTASDLLGKKLDSNGYSVVPRKEVDEVLQEKKLTNKQIDAGAAASVGRVVGADAVIVGSVQTAQQPKPEQALATGSEFRAAAPAPPPSQAASQDAAKAKKESRDVEVTATAIDTKTANNLAVASEQTQQTPGGGLSGTMDRVAGSLRRQIQQKSAFKANITGKVTDVTQSFLTLDLGAASGVKVGDQLQVFRKLKLIGRVKITSVKESLSVGEFQGKITPKAGDTVTTR